MEGETLLAQGKRWVAKYWETGVRFILLSTVIGFVIVNNNSTSYFSTKYVKCGPAGLWLLASIVVTFIYSAWLYVQKNTAKNRPTKAMVLIQILIIAPLLLLLVLIAGDNISIRISSLMVGPYLVGLLLFLDYLAYRNLCGAEGNNTSVETRKARSICMRLDLPIFVGVVITTLAHFTTAPGDSFIAGATAMQIIVGNFAFECFLID